MGVKDDRERMLSGSADAQTQPQKGKKPKKIARTICLVILSLVLLALLGLYIAGAVYYQERFYKNTKINGFDVSEMTVAEVESIIADEIGSYKLTIEERGGDQEVITADEIGYRYVSKGETQAFKDSQNPFLWPQCFWKSASYTFDSSAQYDETKIQQTIEALGCLDESKAVAPEDAYIDYLDGVYQIIPEVEGNLLDRDKTIGLIRESVDFGNVKVSLEDKNCYQIPGRRKNDEGLLAAKEELNTLVSTNIVYRFGSDTETLNGETLHQWVSWDEDGEVTLHEENVYEFVYQLAQKYDTADKPRDFVTHSGSTVSVSGGYYGWVIDQEGEVAELLECIRGGYQGERYAVFAQTAVSWENSDLGDTYVEIDLGGQRVYMYVNGQEIVATDCVSGDMTKANRATPSGTYTLYYKESPSVLRGENNEYESPVTFWMPFNGGIGLHDASWRSSFGGSIFQNNGSHGCINLPYEAARIIYENVYDGIPIICYY